MSAPRKSSDIRSADGPAFLRDRSTGLLLEHPRLREPRELPGLHPEEPAQHVLGMLPEPRRGRANPWLQRREAHRVRLDRVPAEHGVLDVAEVAPMRELRILVQGGEVLDRPRLDTRGLEALR